MDRDTLKLIALRSDLPTIARLCSGSRATRSIAEDDYFWEQLTERHFGRVWKIGSTWKTTYEILNTPTYQVVDVDACPGDPPDIEVKSFITRDLALNYAVERAMRNSIGYDDVNSRLNMFDYSFSTEFQEILDDVPGFEDLVGNVEENPVLMRDYQSYVKFYRQWLRDQFVTDSEVSDDDFGNAIKIVTTRPRVH